MCDECCSYGVRDAYILRCTRCPYTQNICNICIINNIMYIIISNNTPFRVYNINTVLYETRSYLISS